MGVDELPKRVSMDKKRSKERPRATPTLNQELGEDEAQSEPEKDQLEMGCPAGEEKKRLTGYER